MIGGSWSYVQFGLMVLASYLLVFGWLGVISRKKQLFWISLASINASILLFLGIENLTGLLSESLALCLFPLIFLYLLSIQKRSFFKPFHLLHFLLPCSWLMIHYFESSSQVFFNTIQFIQTTFYSLASLLLCYQFLKRQKATHQRERLWGWLFYGLMSILFIRLTAPIFLTNSDLILSIAHTLITIYLIGITYFQLSTNVQLSQSYEHEKEQGINLEEELKRRLDILLNQNKVFLVPDLTLQELATKMQLRSSDLSNFFNQTLGRNFNDVINECRVNEVKQLLRDPKTDPKATIIELAYQAGFNSKATFNRIFKEMTGQTPKAFKSAHQ